MKNQLVSSIFEDIARLLELKGESPFRIRAYERASRIISSLGEDIEERVKENSIEALSGIGRDLAKKIRDIVETGTCARYEELKTEIPGGLLEMLEIPGLGPRSVKLFYEKLGIDTMAKLEEAAQKGELESLDGVREKTVRNILKGIIFFKKGKERVPLYKALEVASVFVSFLEAMAEVRDISVAGSIRRRKETIKDVDILVASGSPGEVIKIFTSLPCVKEIISKGETKASVISKEEGMQVDLRVVQEESFGAALLYFTGSKQFNINLRQLGITRGLKINEYGVFSADSEEEEKKCACGKEEEIFKFMKMQYIPPEMREDREEISLSLKHALPKVIEAEDIKGDLHVHSFYSDGAASIEANAVYARELGYEYIGIADHSQSLKVAGGLSVELVGEKIREVKKLNRLKKNIRILCGAEVDILRDGLLDYPESVLREFDFIIAAIHSGLRQSRAQLTRRIISACENKYVNIIAHPTGRLFGVREPSDFSFDEVIRAAAANKVALEINSYPQRMDLDDIHCMRAVSEGVKISIGSDAHAVENMRFMRFGVGIARRGWLERKDVINCWDIDRLEQWLKK